MPSEINDNPGDRTGSSPGDQKQSNTGNSDPWAEFLADQDSRQDALQKLAKEQQDCMDALWEAESRSTPSLSSLGGCGLVMDDLTGLNVVGSEGHSTGGNE